MMQEVFDKLKTLQQILSEKYQIERELSEIPKALLTKKELLNRLKKGYIDKNAQITEIKNKISELKKNLGEAEIEREKYEKQMDMIKTQREYEALDKEIKDASEKEQQLRKDILKEEKRIEEIKESLEKEEKMISLQEGEISAEESKIKSKSHEKESQIQKLNKKEKDIIPGMDEEILFKFERIIKSKSGLGIVPVAGKVCLGCYMVLPSQFVNEVRQGKKILFCPYCSRILFYQESEEDQEENIIDTYDEDKDLGDEETGSLSDLDDLSEE